MSRLSNGAEEETIEEIWNIPDFEYYFTGGPLIAPHEFYIGTVLNQIEERPMIAEANVSLGDVPSNCVLSISLKNQNQNPHWTITAKFASIQFMKKAGTEVDGLNDDGSCWDRNPSTSVYSVKPFRTPNFGPNFSNNTPSRHESPRSEEAYVAISENLLLGMHSTAANSNNHHLFAQQQTFSHARDSGRSASMGTVSPILHPQEVNLQTTDCTFELPINLYSARNYVDTSDESLTIKFSLHCKITKNAISIGNDINKVPSVDLQLCRSQALSDFEALLNDATTADIKLKTIKGEPRFFYCHKSILAARSPVFRAMFETAQKESKENVITVKDISAGTMEHFLSFLYCGSFQGESWINFLPHLTDAAEKYCVNSLKEFCDSNLIRSVTCENAIVIASLAQKHQLAHATVDIRNFIARNAGKLNLDIEAATQNLGISK